MTMRTRTETAYIRIKATFDNDHAATVWDEWGCRVAVGTPLEHVVAYLWMDYLTRNGRIRMASDGAYVYPAEGWMVPEVTDEQSRRPVDWHGPALRDLALHLRRMPRRPSEDAPAPVDEL